jgi:hypothetical protein
VHSRFSAVCGRCVIRHPHGVRCSPTSTCNSSRYGPDPATPLPLDGAAEGISDGGTGQEHQRPGMLPLYAARIEDRGPGDFVKVDCAACHHVALLPPEALMRVGLSTTAKVLDLKGRSVVAGAGGRGGRWFRLSGEGRGRNGVPPGADPPATCQRPSRGSGLSARCRFSQRTSQGHGATGETRRLQTPAPTLRYSPSCWYRSS